MRRALIPSMAILLGFTAGVLVVPNTQAAVPAQQESTDQDSVAQAARRTREQKKEPAKPAKLFTNDDLGNLKGTISVVGNAPAPDDNTADKTGDAAADGKPDANNKDSAKAPDGADSGKAPDKGDKADAAQPQAKDDAKGEAYWRKQFADARRTLADDAKELDVLQREYNLKQQQYYSDPNVAMEQQYSRSDLDKTLDQINAKKADVEKDKQAISDLEDDLRKAGGEPGWASEP